MKALLILICILLLAIFIALVYVGWLIVKDGPPEEMKPPKNKL